MQHVALYALIKVPQCLLVQEGDATMLILVPLPGQKIK